MLRKPYDTFLYLLDDPRLSRRLRLRRGMILAAGLAAGALLAMAICFLSGVGRSERVDAGASGGDVNDGLSQQVARLEQKIALLQADLAAAWDLQATVAATVGLDTLDAVVREAGVGGREPLIALPTGADPATDRVATLDCTLDQLLRQARLQRQGYQAILDTLQERVALQKVLPTIRPVGRGWLTSTFGVRMDPFTGQPAFHEGVDISVPAGTPVVSTADGLVRDVVFERGFGHMVIVQHDGRTVTRYAHLSKPLVARGQAVRRGDVIALSGRSGRATSPHLHYEVLVNGRPVNPMSYIFDEFARRR